MNFDLLRERLRGKLTSGGQGATEEQIAAAEEVIGSFDREYRRFVNEFGWVEFDHYEIYGLGDGIPEYLDVVRMTVAERTEPETPLREDLICIMNDGGGNLFCFGSRSSSRGGDVGPIVLWNHDLNASQTPEVIAETFSGWLAGLVGM